MNSADKVENFWKTLVTKPQELSNVEEIVVTKNL